MIAAAATALDNSICRYEENGQEKNASRAGDEKEWMLLTFDPIALKYINRRVDPSIQRKYTKIGEHYNMCFKLVKSDSKLVRSILFAYGFLHCSAKNPNCNLLWTNTHLSTTTMRQLRPWQRMNHFPRSWMITRKDVLYENVGRAAIQYGYDWFNFIPDFFCTPLSEESKQKLHKCLLEIECSGGNGSGASPFIVKPVDGSFGRGIFFLEKAEQISLLDTDNEQQQNDRKLLISRYISRPYLINQLKWDLRIYVLVTSFYPLIAYVYNEGLARFAVHEYKDGNANLADVNQHLTNYSLNKSSQEFVRNTDCTHENEGHKWTLGALLRELETVDGVDTGLLMVRIEDVVIKTLLSVQPKVAAMCRKLNLHQKCCFELFGFDILIDEDLKPWLLEVNLSPSLTCDSPLDSLLKSHLYCNVLNIAQIPLVCDKNAQNQCHWEMEEETTNGNEDEKETRGNDEIQSQNSNDPQQTTQNAISISSNSASSLHSNANLHSENGSDECSSMNEGRPPAAKQRRLSPPLPAVFGGKVRKIQAKFTQKITYSADRITPRYLERVKLLHEKLKSEESRRDNFTRIFPRKTTWDMYRLILEDSGQERWDEALHRRMMTTNAEKEKQQELAIRDIRLAHEQLMDAKNFKHRKQLDPIVKDYVLAEALQSAECYKLKMYPGDLKPYPSALPKIRPNARRRTRSQCVAEEVRKKKLEQRKAAMEGGGEDEKNTALTNGPLAEMNLNNIVERSSSDKDKLMQTAEYC